MATCRRAIARLPNGLKIPVYPLLFAAYPLLYVYAENKELVHSFRELLPADDRIATRLSKGHAGCRILRHARIPFISYPYEWTLDMLADAAHLHLDLQMQLVEKGYSLKDASAYNVQFCHGRPVFIDIPSIEKPARLDICGGWGSRLNR